MRENSICKLSHFIMKACGSISCTEKLGLRVLTPAQAEIEHNLCSSYAKVTSVIYKASLAWHSSVGEQSNLNSAYTSVHSVRTALYVCIEKSWHY